VNENPSRQKPESAPAAGTGHSRPVVVILTPDLFTATSLEEAVRAQGGEPVTVTTPQEFLEAVDRRFPVLAAVDLQTPGDWAQAIRRCKLRPHTRHTPIYAFGSHVDTETLRRARQAGADYVWARSRMAREWPQVVARHLRPAVRELAGCQDPLSRAAARGLLLFNQGDYFEQHEYLEEAWRAEERPVREMYQGILQVGVAFLQIQRGNWAGAIKLFRRGLPRLRDLPPVCQGVQVGKFREAAEAIHREITRLGPEGLAQFDTSRFPRIEFENPYPELETGEQGAEDREDGRGGGS